MTTLTIPTYYKLTQEEFNKAKSLSKIQIECQECFKVFETVKKNILKGYKDRNSFVSFCSAACSVTNRTKDLSKTVECSNCKTEITKTLTDLNKSVNHFCSRSCAASFNNALKPKRKLTRTCIECTNTVFTYRHTRCEHHHTLYKENKYINKTIGEYRKKLSVKGKHPSWINSHIRLFAKSWNKDLVNLPCAKCKYTKHVELAHIKGVSTYSDNTLLSEVNSPQNLIQLCPNCHWEFDNGYRDEFKDILQSVGKVYTSK